LYLPGFDWTTVFLQIRFLDSLEAAAMIRTARVAGEQGLFRSRLDQIVDMKHALVKLSRAIDCRVLKERFGSVYTDGPGSPPLPTRLMADITVLKYMHDLSDEAVCDRWVENPYFQFFCGEIFSAPAGVRPLVADALAPAVGRGITYRIFRTFRIDGFF
jgi:hypothetical protein